MAAKRAAPTFLVRFVAPDLSPSTVPLRAVSEALAAVQDLASGRDPMETDKVPPEKVIGLLNVRRGSAIYSCISRAPDEARRNLRLVGRMLESEGGGEATEENLVRSIKPIERLSEVAKNMCCRVEVALAENPKNSLFAIEASDFGRLSRRLFLSGETTIIGKVQRVGGKTGMKCALSVPGRRRLLYCDVADRKVARSLGQHLYEEIVAQGKAVWIHRSWHVYKFTISGFTQPRLGDPAKAMKKLRAAGLDAWDEIDDPQGYFEELRS